eukprot:m.301490 g.301490  ORF g.301490 m.301490 type:complete len:454 (-) comp14796_c0_seq1:164-1525(-)
MSGADIPRGTLAGLPEELLLAIIAYLPPLDVLALRLVARRFARAAADECIWRPRVEQMIRASDQSQVLSQHLARPAVREMPFFHLFWAIQTTVITAGHNVGPEDWGVPTPPPPSFGQLGRPSDVPHHWSAPQPVQGFAPGIHVVQVASGGFHTMLLTAAGDCYAFGSNAFGQLGLGDRDSRREPTRVTFPRPEHIAEIQCGYAFTLFRTSSGAVYSCGFNQNGRLGIPDSECTAHTDDGDSLALLPQPTMAVLGRRIIALAGGSGHCAALDENRTLLTWGRNDLGQLGNPDRASEIEEFEIRARHHENQWRAGEIAYDVVSMCCDSYSTLFQTSDGGVFVCGAGRPSPTKVHTLPTTCFLVPSGALLAPNKLQAFVAGQPPIPLPVPQEYAQTSVADFRGTMNTGFFARLTNGILLPFTPHDVSGFPSHIAGLATGTRHVVTLTHSIREPYLS